MNTENQGIPEFKSVEEEREYWESRGALAKGHRGKLNTPDSKVQRSFFLSVRLSSQELTEWRKLAADLRIGPSTLARNLIVSYLQQVGKATQQKGTGDRQPVTFEQLCSDLVQNLPKSYSNRIENLMDSSLGGDPSNPSFLFMDPNQLDEYLRVSALVMAWMYQRTHPNSIVEIPRDFPGTIFHREQSEDTTQQAAAKQ